MRWSVFVREKALHGDQPKKKPASPAREHKKRERMVFLFTGYMVSHAGKTEDQFPAEKEELLKAAINAILDKHGAEPSDLAITTGMDAGSELIFVECCTEREISVQAYFPETEAPYIRDFVSPGGDEWVDRFFQDAQPSPRGRVLPAGLCRSAQGGRQSP